MNFPINIHIFYVEIVQSFDPKVLHAAPDKKSHEKGKIGRKARSK